MGGFQFGPDAPNLDPVFAGSYQVIADDGWSNANTEQATPFCTFCADENLVEAQND